MAIRPRTENFRVPNNFGSGFWVPNTPTNITLVFVAKQFGGVIFLWFFFGTFL